MGGNVIFAVGYMLAVAGFYCQKKSERRLQGITWMVMSLFMVLCFHVLAAPLIQGMHIPCSALSFGILDGGIGTGLLLYCKKKKNRQEYVWDLMDLTVVVGLGILVVWLGLQRYGFPARFVYLSTDASTHYHEAFSVLQTGKVDAMYFSALNDSFLVSFFSMFYKETDLYRSEVYIDLLWLYLTGISFYGFTRKKKGKFGKLAGIVLLLLYLVGYPLNHMLTGFLYQGMGVVLVCVLWKIAEDYLSGNLEKKVTLWYLLLGCSGLICCYSLFVPPVFSALFFVLAKKAWKERKKFIISQGAARYWIKWVLENLLVFFYPCLIGIVFTFQGIFKDGVTLAGAIQLEGLIYRNNFTDFVFLLPLAFGGILYCFRKKAGTCLLTFFFLEAGYMFLMFCASYKGYVSAYYYYKNNYFMWLLLYLLASYGVELILERNLEGVFMVCFGAWLVPSLIVLTGIFSKVAAANHFLAEDPLEGYDYCAVYMENKTILTGEGDRAERVDMEPLKKELYEKAFELYVREGAKICPVAYGPERYLEEAITNQWYVPYLFMSPEDVGKVVKETHADYICVVKDSEEYARNEKMWENFPKVYENEAGFLARCGANVK